MKKLDKVIDKCKKLLAMAEDCSNENESQTAMRQLQKILAKHNLSLSEIELTESKIDRCDWTYSSSGVWSRTIIKSICQLYFCDLVYARDSKKQVEKYMVYGTEINRLVAMQMSKAAVKLINKLANKAAKEVNGGKIDYPYRVSFRNGAATRIAERCFELIELAKSGQLEDDNGSKLPVLKSVYDQQLELIKDHLSSMNLQSTKSKMRSTDYRGHSDGQKAGNKVKLRNDSLGKQQNLLGN